ncbi:hypothetical protein DASC09_015960 [Saccharomycopsis crataegensis]|uniref:WSC domain-containing protein n=1 Tax=Saccharomycopsis crataegensis TaxID=43959 RepID=A0AAV5QHX4_9ASCO|nr:hypothetical protein DASC09_015960 [Saccharomycopsis crataegensis]
MVNLNLSFFSVLILSLVISKAQADGECYSSLPSSYSKSTTYIYQSTGYCLKYCAGYTYYALYNGSTCLCGNDAPDSSDETDSSDCSVACSGYDLQTCGGSSAYAVYAVDGTSSSSSSSGSSSSSSTITSSSSSSSSTDTSSSVGTSATSATTTKASSSSDSTYVELVTQVSTESGGGTHIVTVTASRTSVATSVVSDTSSSSGSNNKAKLIGPIVGGVIGGLAALSILALVIFFIRRQRQKDRDLLDADANIIASMKRNENSSHARQLSNPFADDFVDPPARNTAYYGISSDGAYGNENNLDATYGGHHDMDLGNESPNYYDTNHGQQRSKLAVVNPDNN